MNLSNYSNRELVKELTKRKDFMGCVLHYSRGLGSPAQDTSQAMIAVSKQMDSAKALQLLKAAVRAMERGAKEAASGETVAIAPSAVPAPKHLRQNPVDPTKFVSIRPDSD